MWNPTGDEKERERTEYGGGLGGGDEQTGARLGRPNSLGSRKGREVSAAAGEKAWR